MYNESTYTFGMLKENIYKVLDEFTQNGEGISTDTGIKADMEKRFISILNMCKRRVMLSFPLLEKQEKIVFSQTDNGVCALLPEDFEKANQLNLCGIGEIAPSKYLIINGFVYCTQAKSGDSGILKYCIKSEDFTEKSGQDDKVNLPDITCDALVYLTASELCPTDYSELFSKLMYKYRDLAINCYNIKEDNKTSRNSFYSVKKKLVGR